MLYADKWENLRHLIQHTGTNNHIPRPSEKSAEDAGRPVKDGHSIRIGTTFKYLLRV
jgi:hypothetical protein